MKVYQLVLDRFGGNARRRFVPVLQPLGHRRRQGLRLPLRVGEPHRRARTSIPELAPDRVVRDLRALLAG